LELLLTIGGKEIFIPDSIVNMYFVVIILTIFALIVNKKIQNATIYEAPSGFLNVVEMLVDAVKGLVATTMGSHNMGFAPYILTLVCFLGVSNLLGLIGLTPPTSDYSVTLSLALITFALTQIFSYKNAKGFGGYLKSFTEPLVLLTPINLLGEVGNVISLSFRLFGNVMSGGIIITLLYSALGYFAPFIAGPLQIYFDVFSGLLQTFIFAMLTMIFVGGNSEPDIKI
jgi:F-type H+-transporting ATPase subunit a